MVQISILQGVKIASNADVIEALPINLEPSLASSGVSEGYLTSVPGISQFSSSTIGRDRCSINWNGNNYRIQGSKLVKVDVNGNTTILGDVGDDGGYAFIDYGFDRLAIAATGFLWYFNGTTLSKVTDPSATNVFSVIWIDGYFMFTDKTDIVVTELNDPTHIIPTSYATAEIDPDPIQGIIKIRDEAYAIGQYTIQNFQNVGGSGFPFANNKGAYIPRGSVGVKSFCEFNNNIAFVGSGKDEAISVYLAGAGESICIASNAVEKMLQALTLEQQQAIELERIVESRDFRLLLHLSDKTLVYSMNTSKAAQQPIWTILAGGTDASQAYPIRHFSYVFNKFIGASPVDGRIGYLDNNTSTHFGVAVGWEFQTTFIYNQGGFTITQLELVAATGFVGVNVNPQISFSYSRSGQDFSQEKFISQGKVGDSQQRLVWRPMCMGFNFMNLKFKGANTAIASIMRLEATIEGSVM